MMNDLNSKRLVKIITLGCRVNQYESRALAEALEKYNIISVSQDEKDADFPVDFCIVNTCAVTAESERKSRQMIRRLHRQYPSSPIIVMGCASQLKCDDFSEIEGVCLVAGCRNKTTIAKDIVCLDYGYNSSPLIAESTFSPDAPLCDGPITAFDRIRAYVKIEDGCNGNCAYCIIKKARGTVVSRDESEIIDEIKVLAKNGCKEIVLTGIETAAYSHGLASLIKKVDSIDGIERIRLGSMDPAAINQEFIDAVSDCKHFMPHLHLSLQSGCSRTLKTMRRKYNANQAMRAIIAFRNAFPSANLSADIICGFPGESDEDFNETIDFCRKAKLLHAHIFTYSIRPNTEAADMPYQLDENIKNERSASLSSLQAEIKKEILDDYVGNIISDTVLIETYSKGIAHGHTGSFIECEIKCDCDLRGEIVKIRPVSHDGDTVLCELAD